jgi:phage-related protein
VTQPVDRAFVEIVPDTRDFTKDLNDDVAVAYEKLQRQTDKVTAKVSQSFDAAGNKIERTFTTIEKDGELTVKVIEKAFTDAGERITRVFAKTADKAAVSEEFIAEVARLSADTAADSFERAGERIEDAFREASRVAAIQEAEIARQARQASDALNKNTGVLDRTFKGLFETIVSLGSALVGLGAAAPTPAGLIAILATITAIAAATGPIIALVGALADLIGLIGPLPAALGVLIAAVLPLVFAFQGLGDAIKAVNDGDPEKIAAAMKKLAPAARSVVKEITGLNGVFDKFRKSIQQSFFAPLVGDITRSVRTILPAIQKSIDQVATAFGRAASNLLEFLREPKTIAIFNQLFSATAGIVDKLGVGILDLIQGFTTLFKAGLPFVQRFVNMIAQLATKFSIFIDKAVQSGAFNKFVEDAIDTTKELFSLVGAIGNLFDALFSNADDEGRDFIATLTEMVNQLADFLRTAEGQEALQNLVDTAKQVGLALILLGKIIQLLFKEINFIKHSIEGVVIGFKALVSGVKTAVSAIGDFIGATVATINGWITIVIDFFIALPGEILDAIKKLPGLLANLFNFMLDQALKEIGIGIGLIIFTFTQLPQRILAAILSLPGIIRNFFVGLWTSAKTETVKGSNSVIDFIKTIPGRVLSFIKTVGPIIANVFRDALSSAKAFVVNGFNSIVNFVKSVPGRIRDAFKAAGGFVSDIGGAIAGAIKSFLNRAIDRINDGISSIDDILPGSLPRIPRLAKGGVINPTPGGTLAVLGEAGQREIAAPEDLLRKILSEEQSPGIVFGPGSVVVQFDGVVPTDSEARLTGLAVGRGIIDALARRDIRTTVRAL